MLVKLKVGINEKSKVVKNDKKQVRKLTDKAANLFTFEEICWSLYSFIVHVAITRNGSIKGSKSGKQFSIW